MSEAVRASQGRPCTCVVHIDDDLVVRGWTTDPWCAQHGGGKQPDSGSSRPADTVREDR
jgi:hypothetical protein